MMTRPLGCSRRMIHWMPCSCGSISRLQRLAALMMAPFSTLSVSVCRPSCAQRACAPAWRLLIDTPKRKQRQQAAGTTGELLCRNLVGTLAASLVRMSRGVTPSESGMARSCRSGSHLSSTSARRKGMLNGPA